MNKKFLLIFLLYSFNFNIINSSLSIDISNLKIAKNTDQLLFVIPKSYDSHFANFYYFIKKGNEWELIIEAEAYIGKNGLGKTIEGDYKTPVGAFIFNKYFGIEDNPGAQLPYIKLNESLYWDCDSNSEKYNQMVNIETYSDFNKKDSEFLIEKTAAYKYAMNINYNEMGIPHKGSAIFLHCFTKNNFTAGCISISEENMIKVFQNINKYAVIIIDVFENISKY